ncbi:hypothetical protein Aph01nite_78460 [Acrocarpospora phusangensis]|uniref:Uncharacterized protein n=1 Tax=Acrocarpospora phusangensis TaxID=1070424 RepID=A0A919UPD4_9ACTN|nr:hypothetical protein [Acrocarpospora phusangensis]GIH29536.1 hypothetical protein Aph01nite_78460 [Acrocarpospora phusangensis]
MLETPASEQVGEDRPAQNQGVARERVIWTVGATLLVVVMVGLFLRGVMSSSGPSAGPANGLPEDRPSPVYALTEDLRAQLSVQVTGILEKSSPAQHHAHGHDFGDEYEKRELRVVCAVDPFGVEPVTATTLAEVRIVYAQHMCAVDELGDPWAKSIRVAGPLAVTLTGKEPVVELPLAGEGYPEHVRELIPPYFLESAFSNYFDPQTLERARERFESSNTGRASGSAGLAAP